MANIGAVRDALIRLMTDKGSNVIARGAGGRPTAIVDDAGKQIDEIPPAPQMANQLRESRQHAREVQGDDPLATSIQEAQPIGSLTIPKELKMQRVQNLRNKGEREAPQSFMQEHWSPSPSRTDKGPADLKRTSPKDPSRLPDSEGALSKQEMIGAMEAEFVDLQKEFERLAGRPPTPDEMDVGTLEHLIDILKDASGETRVPRASNLNPLDDEIPF